jgi:hypothetical protein
LCSASPSRANASLKGADHQWSDGVTRQCTAAGLCRITVNGEVREHQLAIGTEAQAFCLVKAA